MLFCLSVSLTSTAASNSEVITRNEALAILGVTVDSSLTEIKRTFLKLSQNYQVVTSKEKDPIKLKKLNDRYRKLIEAYQILKKSPGGFSNGNHPFTTEFTEEPINKKKNKKSSYRANAANKSNTKKERQQEAPDIKKQHYSNYEPPELHTYDSYVEGGLLNKKIQNYFVIAGVNFNSTPEEIKAAVMKKEKPLIQKLMQKISNSEREQVLEKIIRLRKAKEILLNPIERAKYIQVTKETFIISKNGIRESLYEVIKRYKPPVIATPSKFTPNNCSAWYSII